MSDYVCDLMSNFEPAAYAPLASEREVFDALLGAFQYGPQTDVEAMVLRDFEGYKVHA